MKNKLLILFALLLSITALTQKAQAALGIWVPQYLDVLPINGALDCRFLSDSNFGYLFKRTSEQDVTMDVISKGVSEGEKTRMSVKINPDMQSLNYVFLQFFTRFEDYGKYTEFRISTMVHPVTLQIMGDMMFTESSFERDANGKEKESFRAISKNPIACKIL